MKYFVTVAETLSFSAAARALYITQGTLSQQIRQLENELGTVLFNRSPHAVTLTEAGSELLPLAKRTIDDMARCRQMVDDLGKGLSGTLSIGVTHSFAGLLTGTVREFLKEHRNVQLKIFYKTATELHQMLRDGQVDFIIAFKPAARYEEVISEPLFYSDLAAIMRTGHPLAGQKSVSLQEISRYGIVLPGSGLQSRKAFERFIDVDTSGLDVRVELNEPNIIMDIVAHTDMVTAMSTLAVHYNKSLTAIPITGVKRDMIGCVHYLRNGYHKKSAEAFISMLRTSASLARLAMD